LGNSLLSAALSLCLLDVSSNPSAAHTPLPEQTVNSSVNLSCPNPASNEIASLAALSDPVALIQSGTALGSGIVISDTGTLITAAHIIQANQPVTIYLPGREALPAHLLMLYPQADVAVLQLPTGSYPCLPLAQNLPSKQEPVWVLGLQTQETIQGYIYENRIEEVRWQPNRVILLRLSLNLPQGHSGGPILNARGEVIGIVSARLRQATRAAPGKRFSTLGSSLLFLKSSPLKK
jgi:S1-C subfamily serine protease